MGIICSDDHIAIVLMDYKNPLCPKYYFKGGTNCEEFSELNPDHTIEYFCSDFMIVKGDQFYIMSTDGKELLKTLNGPMIVKTDEHLNFYGLKFSD